MILRAELEKMPTVRSSVFDPARDYIDMQRHGLRQLHTPSGIDAWVATRYRDVKDILGDGKRFSSELAPNGHVKALPKRAPGQFVRFDGPDHVRIRRRLAPELSGARMVALEPLVCAAVQRCVDELDGRQEADLYLDLCARIPMAVVCELLAIDTDERERLFANGRVLADASSSAADAQRAVQNTMHLLYQLVRDRRRRPGDDMLSRLLRHPESASDDEVAGIMITLLLAGHETTASQIALSVLALILHFTDPLEALERAGVDRAVEELMRYLSVSQYGILRRATADVEIGGHDIPAGDYVVAHVAAANRDATVYPHPDRLLLDRGGPPHLAFGHGLHQCVGKHLARIELRVALTCIFERLRGLRLAVEPEALEFATSLPVYRVRALPTRWEA